MGNGSPRGRGWRVPGRVGGCDSDLMAKSYYSDFYVTCATVIPVFLLVVAVQARTYESALAPLPKNRRGIRALLLVIAYLVVLFGGFGEVGALWELLEKQDTGGWRTIVFAATLALLGVVLYGPLFGNVRATFGALKTDQAQQERRLQELRKIGGLVEGISWQARGMSADEQFRLPEQGQLAQALFRIHPPMPRCAETANARTAGLAQQAASQALTEVETEIDNLSPSARPDAGAGGREPRRLPWRRRRTGE
jgi:hypothetical protein